MPIIYPLVDASDPILHQPARDVDLDDPVIREVVWNMQETLRSMPGAIGLAAPQIGLPYRIFVTHVEHHEVAIVNPRLIYMDPRGRTVTEGCLSYPGRKFRVRRSMNVSVVGYDEFGRRISVEGKNLTAQLIQHELDHLDGITLADRVE